MDGALRRVLILDAVPFIGGAENSMLELARRLPERGFAPVVGCPAEGPLAERARRLSIPVRILDLGGTNLRFRWRAPIAAAQAALVMRREGVDLLHVNSLPLLYVAPMTAWLAHRPWVLHVRDFVTPEWARSKAAWFLRGADRVLCNSRAVCEAFDGLGARVEVVYNGVDLGSLAGIERAAPGEQRPLTIGIVGYVIPRKGHEDLLEAARLLREEYGLDRFRIRIVGEDPLPGGPYRAHLRELAARSGLNGQVEFTGFQEDLREVYASLDILAMPSWKEPFGRVLIEAMAAGLPTVACASGGAVEVVREGETGLLVPPGDPRALAGALARLFRDAGLRARLGAAGVARAAAEFDLDRHADRIAGIYREVLARTGSGRQ